MQHLSLLSFPNLLEPLSLRGQSWYNRNSSGFPKQKGQKFLGEMKREDTHLMVRSVWIPTSKKSPNCLAAFSVCGNSNTNTVSHMITCSTTSQNCSFTLLYHHCHGQFDSTVFNNIAGNNHCMLKKNGSWQSVYGLSIIICDWQLESVLHWNNQGFPQPSSRRQQISVSAI